MNGAAVTEEGRAVHHVALRTGIVALFDLALGASQDDAGPHRGGGWAGLPPEAAAQFVIGLHTLIADLHRDGRMERPWPEDEVVEIILRRVAPLLAASNVTPTADGAFVTFDRPEHIASDDGRPWERAVVSTIALLGKAVRPDLEVRAYLPEPGSPHARQRVLVDVLFEREKEG